ncbi:MAG: hypothetical protein GY866_33460 [Proteobacteria bacterium]|nr:hypothetical protein [Pseudomonadota bacterium]
MTYGKDIELVTRAVKTCLVDDAAVTITAASRESADNLDHLVSWLGYGKLVDTKVVKRKSWQVVVVPKRV